MEVRVTQERNLDVIDNVCVKYGLMNKNKPNVVFVQVKCWIIPSKEIDFKRIYPFEDKYFKDDLIREIKANGIYSERMICDMNILSSLIKKNEKRFLSIEMFFRKKNTSPSDDIETHSSHIRDIMKKVIGKFISRMNDRGFEVRKDK